MYSYFEHPDGWQVNEILDSALFPDLRHYPLKFLLRSGCDGEPYIVVVLSEIVVSDSDVFVDYCRHFVHALVWYSHSAQGAGIAQLFRLKYSPDPTNYPIISQFLQN